MDSEKDRKTVLILFAHPALQRSRVNRLLIRYVDNIDGVTIHDLYETYPDFHINVKHEQNLLLKNDIIIFHHPVFWFSTPAILKEWQDLVLVHGWAYGKEGTALRGKKLLSVVSTGGRESFYTPDGFHKSTMVDFMKPIQRTASICGMEYLPPFIVYGTHTLQEKEINRYGDDYRRIITAMCDGNLDYNATSLYPKINATIE